MKTALGALAALASLAGCVVPFSVDLSSTFPPPPRVVLEIENVKRVVILEDGGLRIFMDDGSIMEYRPQSMPTEPDTESDSTI